jgi:hypothetical protein
MLPLYLKISEIIDSDRPRLRPMFRLRPRLRPMFRLRPKPRLMPRPKSRTKPRLI